MDQLFDTVGAGEILETCLATVSPEKQHFSTECQAHQNSAAECCQSAGAVLKTTQSSLEGKGADIRPLRACQLCTCVLSPCYRRMVLQVAVALALTRAAQFKFGPGQLQRS